jgi:hypothetical protein
MTHALLLLASLSCAAGDDALNKRVETEIAAPAFKEVTNAAKALGSADQKAPEPSWGSWLTAPTSPGAKAIVKFIEDYIVNPLFSGANAQGAAKALASGDAHASAHAGQTPSEDRIKEGALELIGMGRADPSKLGLMPTEAKPAAPEKRQDSTSLVFKKKRR